jgi:hypothetical protein
MQKIARAAAAAWGVAVGLLIIAPTAARATTYDAVNGFSKKSNPNGPWSDFAAGQMLTQKETEPGDKKIHFWWNGKKLPNAAIIGRNYGKAAYQGPTVFIFPGRLDMDPEQISDVTVRFTVPNNGYYTFNGSFEGADTQEAPHGVAIAKNGTIVFTRTISAFKQLVTFNGQGNLKKGDTLDFINQTDGTGSNLSVGLKLMLQNN